MTEAIRIIKPDEQTRLAEIGELSALAYLADGIIDASHPYTATLRDAHARARDATLLAMADGERGEGAIVGTVTLVPPGSPFVELAKGDEFELRMLAVSPIERGRGIGGKLTRAGMDMAIERGARRIVLSTMESMHAAHRLYERLGFARREDLDWVVADNPDGSVTRLTTEQFTADPSLAVRGVQLIGYSWEP
jgi:ribosomal protein S18 acetylase RimI-like enzyme